ncbi:MAG: hypothetical protein R3188_00150 [Acidiferrobacterales bacterium]|jgi:hypothetical protein|nr:hypothetical protein [Acidiferrobacterales bacterium]
MSRLVPAAWVRGVCLIAACMVVSPVLANEVEIVKTRFEKHGSTWTVDTTLRHNDTGWDHYADKWRVVNQGGKVLGERVLFHPHENEQPFTRSESGINIPETTYIIYVEAHDKVHGWSKQRVRVDLRRNQGDRYSVIR